MTTTALSAAPAPPPRRWCRARQLAQRPHNPSGRRPLTATAAARAQPRAVSAGKRPGRLFLCRSAAAASQRGRVGTGPLSRARSARCLRRGATGLMPRLRWLRTRSRHSASVSGAKAPLRTHPRPEFLATRTVPGTPATSEGRAVCCAAAKGTSHPAAPATTCSYSCSCSCSYSSCCSCCSCCRRLLLPRPAHARVHHTMSQLAALGAAACSVAEAGVAVWPSPLPSATAEVCVLVALVLIKVSLWSIVLPVAPPPASAVLSYLLDLVIFYRALPRSQEEMDTNLPGLPLRLKQAFAPLSPLLDEVSRWKQACGSRRLRIGAWGVVPSLSGIGFTEHKTSTFDDVVSRVSLWVSPYLPAKLTESLHQSSWHRQAQAHTATIWARNSHLVPMVYDHVKGYLHVYAALGQLLFCILALLLRSQSSETASLSQKKDEGVDQTTAATASSNGLATRAALDNQMSSAPFAQQLSQSHDDQARATAEIAPAPVPETAPVSESGAETTPRPEKVPISPTSEEGKIQTQQDTVSPNFPSQIPSSPAVVDAHSAGKQTSAADPSPATGEKANHTTSPPASAARDNEQTSTLTDTKSQPAPKSQGAKSSAPEETQPPPSAGFSTEQAHETAPTTAANSTSAPAPTKAPAPASTGTVAAATPANGSPKTLVVAREEADKGSIFQRNGSPSLRKLRQTLRRPSSGPKGARLFGRHSRTSSASVESGADNSLHAADVSGDQSLSSSPSGTPLKNRKGRLSALILGDVREQK